MNHTLGSKSLVAIRFLIFASFLLLVQCGNESKVKDDIFREVSELLDNDGKRNYLESMLMQQQSLQLEEESYFLHISIDDERREKLEKRKAALQIEQITKIDAYFENFGYPSRAELGEYAAYVPWAVLYYSNDLKQYKEKHFKYYYGAYTFNDIPEEAYYSYLLSFYQNLSGKEYKEDNSMTIEENIYKIYDLLNIDY